MAHIKRKETQYQGFVPSYLIHPPSLKNGETYQTLRNKFSDVGQGQVYERDLVSSSMNFDNKTLDEDTFNVSKSTDYKRADRRGVAAFHNSAPPEERSKPFLGETMYNSTFRNFPQEAKMIVDVPVEAFKESFAKFANPEGELSLKKISNMLSDTIGKIVPDWIVAKFLKTFDPNPTGRFTYSELVAEYDVIIRAIRGDTKKDVVGQPEWLVASKKMPTKILTSTGMKSAMQIAMAHPSERRYLKKEGVGMWSCDNDMLAGTTRDTYHIPGYSGHIPASKRVPKVTEQGMAKNPRAIKNNLRLIYSHDLPGYTGHKPKAARNDIGEKKGGRDPRTTSGSAAVGEDIL
ncbi:hypothetical protein TrRE_jg9088 [Triparma retinervis]|uniref:EF-hand domain-containing protein n=1 Tax=Triparma retinervis TaxID=2557542 RepID=A0A9W6ZBG0_9STRA|nr:hypothetical protein TrRE_jg9088 [Triparma retinervis]